MSTLAIVAIALVVVAAASALGVLWLRWQGPRVVTCPETMRPVRVDLDLKHAATSALTGAADFRLHDCSRWPERAGCDQACLAQIESAPQECLLRNILASFYEDRACVKCGKAFTDIHWHDHKPALIGPDGISHVWTDFKAEEVPAVLHTHRPVCWNCHIAETFRREHPELVTDRPPRPHLYT